MSVVYYTVVYRVEGDKSVQDKWWQNIHPIFLARELPVSVVCVALGDRLEPLAADSPSDE